jgi:hypothetical protein
VTSRAAGRLTPRHVAVAIAAGLGVLGLAMAIRYGLVEPRGMGLACVDVPPPWWCGPRGLLVLASTHSVWGLVAILAGVAGLTLRWRWAAMLAFAAGLAGLVLYDAGTAGPGFLLGLIALLRR